MIASSKSLLGLARVDACRAIAGVAGAGRRVEEFADLLVQRAEPDDPGGSQHLAAEGRSFQAVTAFVQGRHDEAVTALLEAIDRSTRLDRRAHWLSLLGSYLGSPPNCDTEQAEQSLTESLNLYDDLVAAAVGEQQAALQARRAQTDDLLMDIRAGNRCR